MNTTKPLTVLVAVLVASAGMGAAAAVQTDSDADTSVDASYDEGTVEVTVTQNGTGVENVSVEANDEDVGSTDANGTLTFETNAIEELKLAFEGENVDLERTYAIEDGELVLDEESEENETEDNETETALDADVTYDNGTVDVTVTQNDSAVENATVEANDEMVGTTDANGTLTFETNATEELELEIESGEQELELEYVIEDGDLVEETDEDDADESAGPDENASDRAHSVFAVVQGWLDGDREGSLGQLIQDQLDNGNDEAPGNSGNAAENGDDAPGNSGNAPGNAANDSDRGDDEAPGNSGNAPGHGDDADESEDDADESEDDEEADEEDDDDDDHPGNGNGNGKN